MGSSKAAFDIFRKLSRSKLKGTQKEEAEDCLAACSYHLDAVGHESIIPSDSHTDYDAAEASNSS